VIVGVDGPAVIIDARTAAWLERFAGLTALSECASAATDPHISRQLEELRLAAMSWRGSATGTEGAGKPEPAASSKWLSTTQAADLLGVRSRAVVKAIARGRLPATRVSNRHRISREDLEHYRAARAA
jgi:excisionase family DNA binding protein